MEARCCYLTISNKTQQATYPMSLFDFACDPKLMGLFFCATDKVRVQGPQPGASLPGCAAGTERLSVQRDEGDEGDGGTVLLSTIDKTHWLADVSFHVPSPLARQSVMRVL